MKLTTDTKIIGSLVRELVRIRINLTAADGGRWRGILFVECIREIPNTKRNSWVKVIRSGDGLREAWNPTYLWLTRIEEVLNDYIPDEIKIPNDRWQALLDGIEKEMHKHGVY